VKGGQVSGTLVLTLEDDGIGAFGSSLPSVSTPLIVLFVEIILPEEFVKINGFICVYARTLRSGR